LVTCYRARREELRFQLTPVAFAGVFTVALASLVAPCSGKAAHREIAADLCVE